MKCFNNQKFFFRKSLRIESFCLLTITAFLLGGCLEISSSSRTSKNCESLQDVEGGGRLSVFLNLERPVEREIMFSIAGVEVLSEARWVPLSESKREINTLKINKGQVFLGSRSVDPGIYEKLRLIISSAEISTDSMRKELQVTQGAYEFNLPFPLQLSSLSCSNGTRMTR